MAKTIAIVGASRGLGKAVLDHLMEIDSGIRVLGVARKVANLESLYDDRLQTMSLDMSKEEEARQLLEELKSCGAQELWYFAGGGPYGPFEGKEMKDHRWALQVNFLTPMLLLHEALRARDLVALERLVFVGSDIADGKGDPGAASYAAAKHGLKGLIRSVLLEKPSKEIRLFRPGYMDTEMLPPSAPPRKIPGSVLDPQQVARQFLTWLANPRASAIYTLPSSEGCGK